MRFGKRGLSKWTGHERKSGMSVTGLEEWLIGNGVILNSDLDAAVKSGEESRLLKQKRYHEIVSLLRIISARYNSDHPLVLNSSTPYCMAHHDLLESRQSPPIPPQTSNPTSSLSPIPSTTSTPTHTHPLHPPASFPLAPTPSSLLSQTPSPTTQHSKLPE